MRTPGFSSRASSAGPNPHGFTLVEMLVAAAVLVLLLVMVFEMVTRSSAVIGLSDKHSAADNEARTVFDRMAYDFAGMINRPDVDCTFTKNTGNDTMYFYSRAPGYFSGSETSGTNDSPDALVGYRVSYGLTGSNASIYGNYTLNRLGRGILWENGPTRTSVTTLQYLTYPPASAAVPSPTPYSSTTLPVAFTSFLGPPPRFDTPTQLGWTQIISNAVFRLEFCFMRKDGSFYTPPSPTSDSSGGVSFMNAMRQVSTNVAGVVVAIAILDNQSRAMVPATSAFQQAVAALPDFVGDTEGTTAPPQLMQQLWIQAINQPNFASTSGLPPTAASQVRVYQRMFYLTPD